jgi:hypothetical protein
MSCKHTRMLVRHMRTDGQRKTGPSHPTHSPHSAVTVGWRGGRAEALTGHWSASAFMPTACKHTQPLRLRAMAGRSKKPRVSTCPWTRDRVATLRRSAAPTDHRIRPPNQSLQHTTQLFRHDQCTTWVHAHISRPQRPQDYCSGQ